MTNLEMVEMLREKANVSYEEAKAALEQANWDLLDAMVILEKNGKVTENGGSYTTRPEEPAQEPDRKHRYSDVGARSAFKWLWECLCRLIRMGNANSFTITRRDKEVFSLPVTVFVVLLILTHWWGLIALAVGLFCGFRYSFQGPNLGKESINSAMNKAAEAAESVKDGFRSAASGEAADESKKQEKDRDAEN